jgi:hypothetical protein
MERQFRFGRQTGAFDQLEEFCLTPFNPLLTRGAACFTVIPMMSRPLRAAETFDVPVKGTGPSPSLAPPRTFKKLLVANRSEIAIRICRAATELGLRTVAIYAQEDRLSIHRFKADEAYLVGQNKGPVGAYLDIAGIVALAREKEVDLIHPGYGFLAENAEFARACAGAGIEFVGPRPDIIAMMGDKTAARALASRRPDSARHGGGGGGPRRGAQDRAGNWFSAHHQGGVRRRRARHEGRA